MEKKLTIACVLWQGTFHRKASPYRVRQIKYTPDWVMKLRNMVKRNLLLPYEFVCLTNKPFILKGVKTVPLEHDWPGWWSKMELYRPDMDWERVLYLDLDVVILQDLWPFAAFPADFGIGAAFGHPRRLKSGVRYGYNSSVIVFDREAVELIWQRFQAAPDKWMGIFRGDQDFLQDQFPDLDMFPQKWVQKLNNCLTHNGECVPNKRVKVMLCMPKKNDEAAGKYELVERLWR
jgi:hypothetical protein